MPGFDFTSADEVGNCLAAMAVEVQADFVTPPLAAEVAATEQGSDYLNNALASGYRPPRGVDGPLIDK